MLIESFDSVVGTSGSEAADIADKRAYTELVNPDQGNSKEFHSFI